MTGPSTKTLEAKCFCGSVHFTVDVPTSSLPFLTHLCHCSLCRYASGMPAIFHNYFPLGTVATFVSPSSEHAMTSYLIGNKDWKWNFCSTCGCHIGCIGVEKGTMVPATSIFIDGAQYFHILKHNFSNSAKDGGISKLLKRIGNRAISNWNPSDDDPRAKTVDSRLEFGQDGKERLRVECKCGGVSFTIQRPNQKVLTDGYCSMFVPQKDNSKWYAFFDVSDESRLINGGHVVAWMIVPLSMCEPPIKSGLLIGTAKTFQSSEGVTRSFCGTCGATIFTSYSAQRPGDEDHIVKLATGILRAPEGVMAENWLTWDATLASFGELEKYDYEFAKTLQKGMNEWVLERYGVIESRNINLWPSHLE